MISLKKLLKEFDTGTTDPTGMAGGGPSPADMPPVNNNNPNPNPQQQPPPPEEKKPEEKGPEPSNPNEYDFTQDFKAYEDQINKAKNDAKKEFVEKMNEKLLGKKITVNASRGYGQPQKDYDIEKVKKGTVDWYYNKNVVVVTDDNDKEYFLTPGVNIKIHGSTAPSPEAEPKKDITAAPPSPAADGQEEQPPQPSQPQQEPPSPEVPSVPNEPQMPPASTAAPTPTPDTNAAPQPEQPPVANPEDDELQPQQKKKKVQEYNCQKIQKDLEKFLTEYMAEHVKDPMSGTVNFCKYLKKSHLQENKNGLSKIVKYTLEIPQNHLISEVDTRDIQLAAFNSFRSNNGRFGNNINKIRGTVNINKIGRNYLFEITKEII
jgi:hypothetical protein